MENNETISIVVPCYNEEESLPLFYIEVMKTMDSLKNFKYEIIFIDDGSSDNTLNIIKDLCKKNEHVKYLSFSRNFGKESALHAGLSHACGDYIAVLDADLQDPPYMLIDMIKFLKEESYDCIAVRRGTRKGEPIIRSFFSRLFYKIINKISETKIIDGARDFRLMPRYVVDAVLQIPEYNRFSKGIYEWVGFKTKWITYDNIVRVAGYTKWSFKKLFSYSMEGIIAFSTVPLAIASYSGLLFCFLAFFAAVVIVGKTLIWGDPVQGWPALACIVTFIGGIQLFCLGVIGQYISKTYLETKRRPLYIIKEKNAGD